MDAMTALTDPCRLDVWLWRARFFKTRSLSARACEEGLIRLTRSGQTTRVEKPAQAIKPGDHLVFAIGARLIDLEVLDTGERRGPASEAQALYKRNG
jgi:ribosome-associated heat shock protein Hsp15